ncbi:MAG: efflux RND transporter periplasmic adaptor subunit [Deltaproteobacteria bacterium]|nr:efflux RND transporter periplasmic adaptor subunit [Myxococcales bacterium]RZV49342.1 MAG: efflux RND transporter periplasmic adaptor subunit [Deltaproteobacteria bacterium]
MQPVTGRKRQLLWIVPLVAALVLAAWWLFHEAEGPRVEAITPVRSPLVQTVVTSGRVIQRRQSKLGAMVPGTVAELLVDDGDRVEADALLVRLADDDALASLAEAEAAVSESEARLARVQGVGRQMAVQALRLATIEAKQAETEYRRQDKLFGTGAVSELDLERARRDRDQTRSRRVSASLEVAAAAPKGSDVAVAAAALARAQARLTAAQVAVEHTRIRAPLPGVVLKRHVERGEVIQPGEALVTFAGDGPLEVRIQPDESNLALLRLGQRALVSAEAFPDQRVDASIARIAPSIDPVRGTVEVDLTIDDELDLRPDMTVTVEIEVGRVQSALLVPSWLIHDFGGESPWLMLAEDGEARRRDVELGLEGDDMVEIVSGLGEEDEVLPPGLSIEEGDPVRVRRTRPAVDLEVKGEG